MGLVDRFTRDEVSAKIWWPLALVFVVLFVLTFSAANRAAQHRRADAAEWSVGIASQVDAAYRSDPTLPPTALGAIGSGAPWLRAIRVWDGGDAKLLASSDANDAPSLGSAAALNDDQLVDAARQPDTAIALIGTTLPDATDSSASLFQVYVQPRDSADVVQTEFVDAKLLADVHSTWLVYRILFGAAGFLLLVLAMLSMREPLARIGAGVLFYPTSLPRGKALITADEERVLRQAGDNARVRVEGMEARLRELEAAKLGLEGQLQRALSELATRPRRAGGAPASIRAIPGPGTAPRAPSAVDVGGRPSDAPSVPPPAAATVEAAKLKPKKFGKQATPDRDSASERPGGSPSVPRLRAVPPPPADAPIAEPAAPATVSPAFDRAPSTPVAPPGDLEATSADVEASSVDRDDRPVVVPDAHAPRPREPMPDVVVLPETAASASPVEAGSSSDEEASSVLDRLVEPASGPSTAELDPGTIRARLARTAALKKPGSRERRERDRGSDDAP
jgi:hypothetical protein